MPFKIFDLCLTPAFQGVGGCPLILKDSPFDVINALQISFNYLCPFKNNLEVSALSEHPVCIECLIINDTMFINK